MTHVLAGKSNELYDENRDVRTRFDVSARVACLSATRCMIIVVVLLGQVLVAHAERPGELETFSSDRSKTGEAVFGLAINKLEHLIEADISLFEVEAMWGTDERSIALKSESEFHHGSYGGSENQLFLTSSFAGGSVSSIFGVRYLDRNDGDKMSVILGAVVSGPFDTDIALTAFVQDHGQVEGRFELERDFRLASKLLLIPKVEARVYSRDFETISVEMRLAYLQTDHIQLYAGFAWSRIVAKSADENESSALIGLSYEW